jgi:hypothetical protein
LRQGLPLEWLPACATGAASPRMGCGLVDGAVKSG